VKRARPDLCPFTSNCSNCGAEVSDGTVGFGQRGPAPQHHVARQDCLESASSWPAHGTAAQYRWRWARGLGWARRRATSRLTMRPRKSPVRREHPAYRWIERHPALTTPRDTRSASFRPKGFADHPPAPVTLPHRDPQPLLGIAWSRCSGSRGAPTFAALCRKPQSNAMESNPSIALEGLLPICIYHRTKLA
jgi:hypothetical protein